MGYILCKGWTCFVPGSIVGGGRLAMAGRHRKECREVVRRFLWHGEESEYQVMTRFKMNGEQKEMCG